MKQEVILVYGELSGISVLPRGPCVIRRSWIGILLGRRLTIGILGSRIVIVVGLFRSLRPGSLPVVITLIVVVVPVIHVRDGG